MAVEWFTGWENPLALSELSVAVNVSVIDAIEGMNGNKCLQCNGYFAKSLTARQSYYGSFLFKGFMSAERNALIVFREGTTIHCGLVKQATTNYLYICPGTSFATALLTYETAISASNVYRIEYYVNIDDNPNGRFVVKLDGVTVLDYTGDTRNGGASGVIDNFYHGYASNATADYFDDDIIRTDTYPGSAKVGGLVINAEGDTEQWEKSDEESAAYELVADNDQDTFVATDTNGDVNLYGLSNIDVAAASFQALKVGFQARKQAVPSINNLQIGIKSNGTSDYSGNLTLPTAYGAPLINIWETDPGHEDAAFTEASLNALQVGHKAVT